MADRREAGARELMRAARDGGITFVVGAGLSVPLGVPTWGDLAERMWRRFVGREPPEELKAMPHFLPFAFERIAKQIGGRRFPEMLRRALYRGVSLPARARLARSNASLAVLARLLVAEYRVAAPRRIARIITFNADDLLERAVERLAPGESVLKVIARAGHHPVRGMGAAIPVYHVHGFVPQDADAPWHRRAPDGLVFTDAQYWATVASPLSFANRTMAFALHDSRCVFLGTSMTDVNVMRWLGTRTIELEADRARELELRRGGARPARARAERRRAMRHFWIHTRAAAAREGFVAECLRMRGIVPVAIESWRGGALAAVVRRCFPPMA